jgi:hypothetical protein
LTTSKEPRLLPPATDVRHFTAIEPCFGHAAIIGSAHQIVRYGAEVDRLFV